MSPLAPDTANGELDFALREPVRSSGVCFIRVLPANRTVNSSGSPEGVARRAAGGTGMVAPELLEACGFELGREPAQISRGSACGHGDRAEGLGGRAWLLPYPAPAAAGVAHTSVCGMAGAFRSLFSSAAGRPAPPGRNRPPWPPAIPALPGGGRPPRPSREGLLELAAGRPSGAPRQSRAAPERGPRRAPRRPP